jgi:hypothetical protein
MKLSSPPFVPFAVALLASLSAVACSSGAGEGVTGAPEGGEVDATEDEVRASCTNPRRYFATFTDSATSAPATPACAPIPGYRGQWLPAPLFTDAPPEVQVSTCAYQWSGEKYSRPDREAIVASVEYPSVLAPACGTASTPDVAALQPIPYVEVSLIQAGSVGCDVCGLLRNGKLWVILPPELNLKRQLELRLDSGEIRSFQIQNAQARALSITLPAPPAGTSYVQGRTKVY